MGIYKSKKLTKIVSEKKEVTFDYVDRKGKVTRGRRGEIHTMGYDRKGHSSIRAWDHKRNDWRLFHNRGIFNLKVTGKNYEYTKPGYNPKDSGMRHIVVSTKRKVRIKKKGNK